MARYEELPYRTCVGMMLINAAGLVFIGRRAGGIEHVDQSHVWQMPQGGVDPGPQTLLTTQSAEQNLDRPLPARTPKSTSPAPAAATRRSSSAGAGSL